MRRSDLAAVVFLLLMLPATASAQQSDANRAPAQQRPEQPPQPSGQAQTPDVPVQPERTPQQSDQARDREHRSAEDTRIGPDWTARPRGEDRTYKDQTRREAAPMRDQMDRYRRYDDDMESDTRYGSTNRGDDRNYYESRPYPRVKTCIEYENGDEFCRYRH